MTIAVVTASAGRVINYTVLKTPIRFIVRRDGCSHTRFYTLRAETNRAHILIVFVRDFIFYT